MLLSIFHWLSANPLFAVLFGVAIVCTVLSPGVAGGGDGGSFGGDGGDCGGD